MMVGIGLVMFDYLVFTIIWNSGVLYMEKTSRTDTIEDRLVSDVIEHFLSYPLHEAILIKDSRFHLRFDLYDIYQPI